MKSSFRSGSLRGLQRLKEAAAALNGKGGKRSKGARLFFNIVIGTRWTDGLIEKLERVAATCFETGCKGSLFENLLNKRAASAFDGEKREEKSLYK